MANKNPDWTRDEVILALDLYFQIEPEKVDKKNPLIIALSSELKSMADPALDVDDTYRNVNGATSKLVNFKSLDPDYPGEGYGNYSKLDDQVFNEFYNKREELHKIAATIRSTIKKRQQNYIPYQIPEETYDEEAVMAREGRVVFSIHRSKERATGMAKKKKDSVLKRTGKLACEVCSFDFKAVYGDLGEGFAECHHRMPLADLTEETVTKLKDLAIVCANCHRMLHRKGNTISVEELRARLS